MLIKISKKKDERELASIIEYLAMFVNVHFDVNTLLFLCDFVYFYEPRVS